MYRTARALVVLALTTLVVLGAVGTAAATFSTSRSLGPTSISTVTVAAPGAVDTSASWCNNGVLSGDVSWTPSSTSRVSGYAITAYYRSGVSKVVATTGPTTTRFTGVVPNQGSSTVATISVTTTTTYGWTAESAQRPVPPC